MKFKWLSHGKKKPVAIETDTKHMVDKSRSIPRSNYSNKSTRIEKT